MRSPRPGDLVLATGKDWSPKYAGQHFLLIAEIEPDVKYGRRFLILDHLGGGSMLAHRREFKLVSKVKPD
jgi:hypothetical protein